MVHHKASSGLCISELRFEKNSGRSVKQNGKGTLGTTYLSWLLKKELLSVYSSGHRMLLKPEY